MTAAAAAVTPTVNTPTILVIATATRNNNMMEAIKTQTPRDKVDYVSTSGINSLVDSWNISFTYIIHFSMNINIVNERSNKYQL